MKRIVLALVVLGSLPVTAYAGSCGGGPCTTEQINRSLQWLGHPDHEQIGRSRVLHDDGAVRPGETISTVRIQSNAPVGYSIR